MIDSPSCGIITLVGIAARYLSEPSFGVSRRRPLQISAESATLLSGKPGAYNRFAPQELHESEYELAERAWSETQLRGVELEINAITNGLLLTSEVVNRLKPYGLNGFKVTLDGDQATHDRMRPLPRWTRDV